MNNVDQRIVEMQFNNSNFERNARTSMGTLEKLKSALNFGKSTDKLADLSGYISQNQFNGLAASVDAIANRFSTLGIIGMSVLNNLAMKAVNAGERIVSSLTIDQVTSGWSKYAEKTTAVQTIMAATAQSWEKEAKALGFVGSQMDFVNERLDKLNWFTDETSYNFTDMVSNIGKFTSNGIELNTAVTAMQGIANWAAISGQNASTASRAMYNLSQSLGQGSVRLQDWMSIENANMATVQFKQAAMDAAVAVGTLKTSTDSAGKTIYKTAKGTEVTVESFRNTLSDAWLSSDALIKVLGKYGNFTDEIYALSDATGATATQLLAATNNLDSLTSEDLSKWARKAGLSTNDLKDKLAVLASEEYEFGRNAFKAAQEAKTFSDALDATADAASTAWMNIFETMFGDYEHAKDVWTNFANFLYDTLVSPLEFVQETLDSWADNNGQEAFIDNFGKMADAADRLLGPLKVALGDILPLDADKNGELLASLTQRFGEFLDSLSWTEETAEELYSTFGGIFDGFGIFKDVISAGLKAFKSLSPELSQLGTSFVQLGGAVGNFVSKIRASLQANKTFEKLFSGIVTVLKPAIRLLGNAVDKVTELFDTVGTFDVNDKPIEGFKKLCDTIKTGLEDITGFFSGIKDFFQPVLDILQALGHYLEPVKEWIASLGETVKKYFTENQIDGSVFVKLGTGLALLFGALKGGKAINLFDKLGGKLGDLLDGIRGTFDSLSDTIESFRKKTPDEAFKNIAVGLLMIAGALLILSSIKADKIGDSLGALLGALAEVAALMAAGGLMGSVDKSAPGNIAKLSKGFIKFAGALLILSVALKILSTIDVDALGAALAALTASMIVMAGALAFMNSKDISAKGKSFGLFAAGLIVLALALKVFATISWDQLLEGLVSMTISLGVVILALWALDKIAPKAMASGAAILMLSAGLLVLAGAIAAFALVGKMDGVGIGFVTMIAGLVILGGALALLGKAGPSILIASAAMLVAAVALGIFAVALLALSLANPEHLMGALAALAASFVVVAVSVGLLSLMGPTLLIAASALLVISVAAVISAAAFLVLSVGLRALEGVELGPIALGLLEISGALLALSVAGVAALVGAPGLLLAGAALMVLAIALNLMNGLDFSGTAVGLAEVSAAMLAFTVASAGLAVIVAALAPFSAALGLVTVAILAFAAAAVGITMAISSVSNAITEIANSGSQFIEVAPGIGSAAKKMIDGINDAFKNFSVSTRIIGLEAGEAFADGMTEGVSTQTNAFAASFTRLIEKSVSNQGAFKDAGMTAGGTFITAIVDGIQNGASDIGGMLMSTLSTNATKSLSAATMNTVNYKTVGQNLGTAMSNGIRSTYSSNYNAGSYAAAGGYAGARTQWASFRSAGTYLAEGLASGISAGRSSVVKAAIEIATSAKTAMEDTLDINSPSRVAVAIGRYVDLGFANGLELYATYVSGAASRVAEGVIAPVVQMTDEYSKSAQKFDTAFRGTYDKVNSLSSNIDLEQKITVEHEFGELTVKGVTDKDEFVAVAKYAVEDLIADTMRRQYRL